MLRLTLEVPEAGHVVLSVDLLLFFFRLLRVLTVSRSIGPMLPMIWNMVSLLTVMHSLFSRRNNSSSSDDDDDDDDRYLERITRTGPKRL